MYKGKSVIFTFLINNYQNVWTHWTALIMTILLIPLSGCVYLSNKEMIAQYPYSSSTHAMQTILTVTVLGK